MRKFFETLAVFIGNVLNLKATGWSVAASKAAEMRANADSLDDIHDADGKAIKRQTPVDYFLDSLGFAIGMVIVAWLLVQAVSAFLTILPYIIALIVGLVIVSLMVDYAHNKPAPAPATAA